MKTIADLILALQAYPPEMAIGFQYDSDCYAEGAGLLVLAEAECVVTRTEYSTSEMRWIPVEREVTDLVPVNCLPDWQAWRDTGRRVLCFVTSENGQQDK